MSEFSKSEKLHKEKDYWFSLPWNELNLFPTDLPSDDDFFDIAENSKVRTLEIDSEKTDSIVQGLKKFPDMNMSDVLVFSLINTFSRVFGRQWVKINVTNNGRALLPDMEDIDTSRTVSCLTLDRVLCLPKASDVSLSSIQTLSENIRDIPRRGLGYDLLYWANEDMEKDGQICFPIHPNERGLILNYHGMIKKDAGGFMDIGEKGVISDFIYHPKNQRMCQFYFDALIIEGELILRLYYGSRIYREETIENIMKSLNEILYGVVGKSEIEFGKTRKHFSFKRMLRKINTFIKR